jgi:hypothetical protein
MAGNVTNTLLLDSHLLGVSLFKATHSFTATTHHQHSHTISITSADTQTEAEKIVCESSSDNYHSPVAWPANILFRRNQYAEIVLKR